MFVLILTHISLIPANSQPYDQISVSCCTARPSRGFLFNSCLYGQNWPYQLDNPVSWRIWTTWGRRQSYKCLWSVGKLTFHNPWHSRTFFLLLFLDSSHPHYPHPPTLGIRRSNVWDIRIALWWEWAKVERKLRFRSVLQLPHEGKDVNPSNTHISQFIEPSQLSVTGWRATSVARAWRR